MLGTGAAACLSKVYEGRCGNEQHQQYNGNNRHNAAFRRSHLISTLQAVATVQEENSGINSCRKANQADNSVQVTAGNTQQHSERAAQKHQTADHRKKAQHKTCQRRAATLRRKLAVHISCSQGAQHQTADFRTDVLHSLCGMQAQGTSSITQKTGNTQAHVGRIAEKHQHCCHQADNRTCCNNRYLFIFHKKPPQNISSTKVYHSPHAYTNIIYR